MIETSHASILLAVKGLENGACVLARQTIELTLKHLYFATHPVEYGWVTTRDSYKELTFQALIDYVKKTDEHQCFSRGSTYNLCGPIEDNFAFLSRYVHTQSKRFMGYKKLTTSPKVDKDILERFDRVSASLWPALTATLVVFFSGHFARAQEIEKRLIRNALPSNLKTSLSRYLRRRQSA